MTASDSTLSCAQCGEPQVEGHQCVKAAHPGLKVSAKGPLAVGPTLAVGSKGKAALGTAEADQLSPPIRPAENLVGKVLGTNYRVLEVLGAGGMGVVYVVEHISLKKRFAAKVLSADLANNAEAVARFEQEALTVSKLDHDNIISIVDFGSTEEGTVFLVMELLKGKTLHEEMAKGPMPLEEVLAVMVPVCQALATAHGAGIIHRDMKPENVFLSLRGLARPVVKVLDFGVSKVREGTLRDGRITQRGQVLGSPEYMSPEAAGGEEVDHRADVYAVGVMLYQLCCGQVPFSSENYLKVLQQHIGETPRPPRSLNPALPEALDRVILRALSKKPDDRQQDMGELEVELLAALPEVAERALFVPTHTPPSGMFINTPSGMRLTSGLNHRTAATTSKPPMAAEPLPEAKRGRGGLIALLAVILTIGAVGAYLFLRRQETASEHAAVTPRSSTPPPAPAPPPAAAVAAVPTPPPPPVAPVAPVEPAPVKLRVTSSPSGASVRLDGVELGKTPLDLERPPQPGVRRLAVELKGHRGDEREVALDRDLTLDLTLRPAKRRAASPPGLDIKTNR